MKRIHISIKKVLFSIIVILLAGNIVNAQVSNDDPLFITLKTQDSIFFERGFNQCDIQYLEETIAEDLKFYHDKGGFQDRAKFFENTRKYICGNVDQKPIRKLKEGSLVVYALYNNGVLYAAIQNGIHHFYIRENGKEDLWTNTAKFTSVWTLNGGKWMLSDVLSYDHQDPRETDVEH